MAKMCPTQLASPLASFSLLISSWNVWMWILPALSVLSKGKTWFVRYETVTVSHWRGLDQECISYLWLYQKQLQEGTVYCGSPFEKGDSPP